MRAPGEQLREGFLQRAADAVFGFDFFVSYAHDDGKVYPARLKSRLAEAGFSVFLDQTDYVPGMSLQRETRRQVKKSTKVIVIARPKALRSPWVLKEVNVALEDGKTPVLININDSVQNACDDAELAQKARDAHWLRIEETSADADGAPSDHAVGELIRSFDAMRQETKRKRFIAAIAVVLAIATAAAAWQWRVAVASERLAMAKAAQAEQNLAAAIKAIDTLVDDVDNQVRKTQEIPAEKARAYLEQTDRVLNSLAHAPGLPAIRERYARSLLLRSHTAERHGQITEAEAWGMKAIAEYAALRSSNPDNLQYRRSLARSHHQVGDLLEARRRSADALQHYRQSMEILEAVAQFHRESRSPPNEKALALRALAAPYFRAGNVHRRLGQWGSALEYYSRALARIREASDIQSSIAEVDFNTVRSLAFAHLGIGEIHAEIAEQLDAVPSCRLWDQCPSARAATVHRGHAIVALVRQNRLLTEVLARKSDPVFRSDLAWGRLRLGDVLAAMGRAGLAEQEYHRSLEEHQALRRIDAMAMMWQNNTVISLIQLAMLQFQQLHLDAARSLFDQAHTILQAASPESNENLQLLETQLRLHQSRGELHIAAGRSRDARLDAAKSQEILDRLASVNPTLPPALARARWRLDRQLERITALPANAATNR